MLMTQKLLDAGFKAAYAADACVYHSHDFTFREQYRRNYVIGQTMKRYETRFQNIQETGEGIKLAKFVLSKLVKQGHLIDSIRFAVDCLARIAENRMGRAAETQNRDRLSNASMKE